MSILGFPIEELEMFNGYEHYNIISIHANPHTCVVVLQNRVSEIYTSILTDIDGRADCWRSPVIRRKKKNVTYIKTFDELIMTGWRAEVYRNTLVLSHPDTPTKLVPQMVEFFGQRREYGRACDQGLWTWPAEALAEKEEV
jgi:hypothetical protein